MADESDAAGKLRDKVGIKSSSDLIIAMSDILYIPGGRESVANLDGVECAVDGYNAIVFSALEIGNYGFTGSGGNVLAGRQY